MASRVGHRLRATARLVAALAIAGSVSVLFLPSGHAAAPMSAAAAQGRQLYETSCISCHGDNLQGIDDKGPSLIGVGSAAVQFQVETGRMPAARLDAQIERKPPRFTDDQARQIAEYVQHVGGGPQVPFAGETAPAGDVAQGGQLFRINCASCHAFAGGGGALSSGKYAPPLGPATPRQIYAAMLTGPANMPVFGDNQLSPQQKYDIIAYVEELKGNVDPGGVFGLGRLGPTTEGVAIFLFGMVVLALSTLWIAGKS